jgi:hypothetical protein
LQAISFWWKSASRLALRRNGLWTALHRIALVCRIFPARLHWNYTERLSLLASAQRSFVYPVINVPRESAGQIEQLGTKRKFWYDNDRYLFKVGREGTGENWAEKIACEIAELLGLPHARYELATCDQYQGVSSSSFVPAGGRLVHGNELVGRVVASSETGKREHRRHVHTVSRVHSLLRMLPIHEPLGFDIPAIARDKFGLFAGYLLLDALIGNQDRHEENWGVLLHDGELFLAPTFDHASSLGRNESDEMRMEVLASRDVGRSIQSYVLRAKSQMYDSNQQKLGTHEAFRQFAGMSRGAASFWLDRLRNVQDDEFRALVDEVPADWMSVTARDFAFRMLQLNRQELLRVVVP